jgi:hypothetical protein
MDANDVVHVNAYAHPNSTRSAVLLAGPNTAMVQHCTSVVESGGAALGCADIAQIFTGDVLLNCALNQVNSM